jgi:hypothetical protein
MVWSKSSDEPEEEQTARNFQTLFGRLIDRDRGVLTFGLPQYVFRPRQGFDFIARLQNFGIHGLNS